MRVLVTGATGFIGSHLVDRLVSRGDLVCALVRPDHQVPRDLARFAVVQEVDLLQPAAVAAALSELHPDAVCHLAAQSLPMVSWQHPRETLWNNIAIAVNILEAARNTSFVGPILLAGSSSEYAAQQDEGAPISEAHPMGASSPYAVSKIAVDQLGQLYHRRYGLKILRFRPFFMIGTRKTGDFCSDVARKIALAESSGAERIELGNLEVVRDLLDVRDGVEAILLLIQRGQPGEAYNICSGQGWHLDKIVEHYLTMSSRPIRVEITTALSRPIDENIRVGDPRKIMALGWRPRYRIPETLGEILRYWRERVALRRGPPSGK